MNFLALDTSTEHPNIALAKGDETWVGQFPDNSKTSATIVSLCLEGLEALSLSFADLHAIVYSKGPGAFTGLRTAVSIAQGFSLAWSIPTWGFSTLMTLAQNARSMGHTQQRVICALDARMQQVYWSAYRWDAHRWSCLKSPSIESEFAALWPTPWEDSSTHEPTLVVGNATAVKEQQDLGHLLPHSPLTWCVCEPSALALITLAKQHCSLAAPDDHLAQLDPIHLGLATPWYLRDQVAQTTEQRALARQASLPLTPAPTVPNVGVTPST
jgi:tRNA threonylcarbamoyladenosine biosynthesis protein TsaB